MRPGGNPPAGGHGGQGDRVRLLSGAGGEKQEYRPDEFVVHEMVGDSGAILMQTLTNLGTLPGDRRFQFFAAFLKVEGGEGSPARFFAVVD